MTATLATRQRLKAYIDAMPDEEVAVVARILLPAEPAQQTQVRNPLMFTKEESEARLLKGLAQVDAGQTTPLEEFLLEADEIDAQRERRLEERHDPPKGKNPLIFTKEEAEARLLKGLAQIDAGEGIPIEEFLRWSGERRARRRQQYEASRVQG